MDIVVHYEINTKERQAKNHSTGHFEASTLCGNGNYHASKTRNKFNVTCPTCLAILDCNPWYLSKGE